MHEVSVSSGSGGFRATRGTHQRPPQAEHPRAGTRGYSPPMSEQPTPSPSAPSTAQSSASATEVAAPYGTGAQAAPQRRVRIPHLQAMKAKGEKWAMLTAYDMYSAEIFD